MDIDFDLDTPAIAVKPAQPRRRSPIRVWTLMKLVLVLACAFGLLATLARAVASAREAARRSQCTCNLCQIKLALHNYHETYGTLPPAYTADAHGTVFSSRWRRLSPGLVLPDKESGRMAAGHHYSWSRTVSS